MNLKNLLSPPIVFTLKWQYETTEGFFYINNSGICFQHKMIAKPHKTLSYYIELKIKSVQIIKSTSSIFFTMQKIYILLCKWILDKTDAENDC